MLSTSSLHFMKFNLIEHMSTELLSDKLFLELSENNEDKFIAKEVTKAIVEGYYITYLNSKQLVFNQWTNSLKTILVRKDVVVPFLIDLENNVLDIWSNRNSAIKLISKLGILLQHKVIIEPMPIDLEKIANNLNQNNIKIGKIKINDCLIESDIVGSCIFDLKNHSDPLSIVKKYSKNLVQLTLIVNDENQEWLTMIIYRSGSVVVYKSREEISLEILEIIRRICII